jgi:hypothetical protein
VQDAADCTFLNFRNLFLSVTENRLREEQNWARVAPVPPILYLFKTPPGTEHPIPFDSALEQGVIGKALKARNQ